MIINRYIMAQIVKGSLITLLALVCFNLFITFVDELGDVGKGGYDLLAATQYTVVRVPALIVEFMPLAVLLGSMLSLGAMAANSEIIAIVASGVSHARILLAVILTAVVIALVSFLIADRLVPMSETQAKGLRSLTETRSNVLIKKESLWIKDESRIVFIKRLLPNGNASQIQILELDDDGSVIKSTRAASAVSSSEGWLLKEVKGTTISGDQVDTFSMIQMLYPGNLSVDVLEVLMIEPRHMSLTDLNRYLQFLGQNQLDAQVEQLVFWKKVFYPLAIIMMAMLAFPFLMGAQRQSNTSQRLLIGILLGLSFIVVENLSTQLGVHFQLQPLLVAAFPTAIFLIFTWLVYQRQLKTV